MRPEDLLRMASTRTVPMPREIPATEPRSEGLPDSDFSVQPIAEEPQEQPATAIAQEDLNEIIRNMTGNTPAEEQVISYTESIENVPEVRSAYPRYDATLREETIRFSTAEWFKKTSEQSVTIAGIGGIGSTLALLIAKLHPTAMWLYDDDRVEIVNLAGQLYGVQDNNKLKVNAIADTIRNYAKFESVFCIPERFTDESMPSDIMICGFDSMEARKTFYNVWKRHVESKPEEQRKECLFMDGRMSAELLQVICFTGEDSYYMHAYESEFLFDDTEAEETVCSYKQTSFVANLIGGLMANLFVNFCANLYNPIIDRQLPFFTEYRAETMILTRRV